MPINHLEAEAYELPPLSQVAISSAEHYFDDFVAEEESAKLLDTEGQLKQDDENEPVDDSALYIRRTQDEEVIGKGSKVEELIARVGSLRLFNTRLSLLSL